MKEGTGNGASLSLSLWSVRGTWREGFFTWDPEGYVKEGCGSGHLPLQASSWGTMEGTLVYWGICEKDFVLSGDLVY
jgi:hypothetical protein